MIRQLLVLILIPTTLISCRPTAQERLLIHVSERLQALESSVENIEQMVYRDVSLSEIQFIVRNNTKHLSPSKTRAISKAIQEASIKYRVDPLIILAIIKQESNFQEGVTGPTGEAGLMQIMPGWKVMLRITDLYDIRTNILTGTMILRNYLDRFGSMQRALEAYNKGHKSVSRDSLSYSAQVIDKLSAIRGYSETPNSH